MGSHSFEKVTYTTTSVNEAYRRVCDDARHEDGHSGYSGTIATTSGVRVAAANPMTLAQARALASARIDSLSKWDVCEAIALVAETPAEYEALGERQVEVTVTGATYNDPAALKVAIAKALKVKVEAIASAHLAHDRTEQPHRAMLSFVPKVTAVAAKAKTETRFFIVNPAEQRMPRWEDGHPTQAAARAALPTILRYRWGNIAPVEVEIISMTRRVTGEPLVAATVEAKTVTATFTVALQRLTKKATAGTTQAGWMFYGWAAS